MKCQIFFVGFLCVVTKEIEGKSDLKSSLTFLIDDTGSIVNDIIAVKYYASEIFDTVSTLYASKIEDFVLITFNNLGEFNFIYFGLVPSR